MPPVNADRMAFLPLRGHSIPGGIVAVDAVHSDVLKVAPWAPAKPVLDMHGGDCDLVLVAVPKGYGNGFGQYLSDARMLVMDPDGVTAAALDGTQSLHEGDN